MSVSSYRMYPRVRVSHVRVRDILDYNVVYGPFWSVVTPFLGGSLGGSHKSLLDLLVRTDTKGVGLGSSDPYRFIRCEFCGRPIQACRCDPGRDY